MTYFPSFSKFTETILHYQDVKHLVITYGLTRLAAYALIWSFADILHQLLLMTTLQL